MRYLTTGFLRWLLRRLAQLTMWRYRPGIVGVTGSVGKTSTKLAIAAVLASDRHVRVSHGNLNNDFGLPLTILGDWSEEELTLVSRDTPPRTKRIHKTLFWCKVIVSSFGKLFSRDPAYPEILVLEYGADRPGDLKYLLSIGRPNVGVITAIGDIPVHVEFFSGPEEVAREKARVIEYLPAAGFAILNYDDDTVMALQDRTRTHIMTFGFEKGAEVRATRFETRVEKGHPVGMGCRIEYGGESVLIRIDGVLGKAQAYAAAAATAAGLIFGMNLLKISESLKRYTPAPHRMELITGIKETFLIDDSYNASPLSMHAALDTLHTLPAKRKVAILGDMLEIGKYTMNAHEEVGKRAAEVADVLVTVGPRAKFIAEEARRHGLRKNSIYSLDVVEDAIEVVPRLLKKGDLVLVKGSHAIGLEKVVEAIKNVSAGPVV